MNYYLEPIIMEKQHFGKQIKETLKDTHFPKSIEKLKIYISDVENVSMLGAAAQVDQHFKYNNSIAY